MQKKLENLDEIKFCTFACKSSNNKKAGHATYYAQNIIYCNKYKTERNKGALCLDYNKEFQKIWKRKNK